MTAKTTPEPQPTIEELEAALTQAFVQVGFIQGRIAGTQGSFIGVMLDCPPRFGTQRDLTRDTIGPEVAQVMRDLRYQPMPWQEHVLDVAGELDDDGVLVYGEARVTIPRQSGKSSMLLGLHVDRMLNACKRWADVRTLTIHEAQTAASAREQLVHEWHPIALNSDVSMSLDPTTRNKDGLVRSNGKEAIHWSGGGRIITAPPTLSGAHGLAKVALVSLDEAFAHVDGRAEQGARPTMLTHPSPQLWITSTAGTSESAYLWSKVEDGRARTLSGNSGSVAYFEWSADDEDDPGDPDVWAKCSPALGHTLTDKAIRREFESMEIDAFRRSMLNVWTSSQARIIPAAAWLKCRDPNSTIAGRVWFAADASPDRQASISVGGWNMQGVPHVEVVDSRPGLDWVAPTLYTLTRKFPTNAVVVDRAGPIGSVFHDIECKAVCAVEVMNARDMASACGRFLSDVMEANVRHVGQETLDNAVDGAAKRQLLDSWAFARRTSTTDISPLVSCVLANWAVVTNPVRSLPTSF